LPGDLNPDFPADTPLVQDHLSNDQAQEPLAIRSRGRRRVPHGRQVFAQGHDALLIDRGDDDLVALLPRRIFVLDLFQRAERQFPEVFQRQQR